jgi:glutamyl-tRNA reductase
MLEQKDMSRVWFDIAIPRDIEDINDSSIQIYRVDDLQKISKSNYALREEQAVRALDVVEKYTDEFFKWLQALSVEPVIKEMRLAVDEVVEYEVNRAIKKGFVPEEYRQNITYLVAQSFDRFLHQPTKKLRELSKQSEGSSSIEAFREIFEIDTTGIDPQKYKN